MLTVNDVGGVNGEAPVREFGGVWSTPSLTLLPSPLKPGVVAPVRVSFKDQIDLFKNYSYLKGPCTSPPKKLSRTTTQNNLL